jgi:hypothetical protein
VIPSTDPAGKRSAGVLVLSAAKIRVALSAALGLLGQEIDPVGVALRDHDEPLLEEEAEKLSDRLKDFDTSISVADKGRGAGVGTAAVGCPVLGAAVVGCPVLGAAVAVLGSGVVEDTPEGRHRSPFPPTRHEQIAVPALKGPAPPLVLISHELWLTCERTKTVGAHIA